MGKNYATSGMTVVILVCACVVMAASDVIDTSSRDSLAKIRDKLLRLSQVTKYLRSQMHGLASNVVSDYGELETTVTLGGLRSL